ncbi:hypothetical protein C8035_v007128 [Colletotrichum spinosum]|uniref:Uncharacterized protein n=1 Tax=Colletotrichum spinosum TaxID=1347390 RepID=A0A4R8QAG4_9PEZI|nr:hypothetical protein C8035_v007128 [Colletotrichum spinosum]
MSFATRQGVAYTTPFYVTTTSPGGSSPTIVPVIIPFDGIPIICFTCYVKFPPNIQISTPKFCIQLFGRKIGSCPADKGGGGGGGGGDGDGDGDGDDDDDNDDDDDGDDDDEGDDDDGDDDDDDEEEKTSSAEPTSTSSSCTTVVTATYQSVFCSVTVTQASGVQQGQQSSAACVTSAYTTVTGCSATPVRTTVTATATEVVDWQELICDPRRCGAFCELPSQPEPEMPPSGGVQKRGRVREGKWGDPEDYQNNIEKFMFQEVFRIAYHAKEPSYEIGYHPKIIIHGLWSKLEDKEGNDALTTADVITFKDKVEAIAIDNLYGCTGLVVVSQRGAWMGHIWEITTYSEDKFQEMFVKRIRHGIEKGKPDHKLFPWGLQDLIERPDYNDQGVLFGDFKNKKPDDSKPGKTPKELGLRVFLVAPRLRPVRTYPNGKMIPDNIFLNNRDVNRGDLRFPEYNEKIKNEVREIFGQDIPIDVVEYTPTVYSNSRAIAYNNRRNLARSREERHEIEERNADEASGVIKDMMLGTSRGKVLLQYQPAASCEDKASWRLFVEHNPVSGSDRWDPEGDQIFQRDVASSSHDPSAQTQGLSARDAFSSTSRVVACPPRTSSSCDVTATATHRSVFCSVTVTQSSGAVQPQQTAEECVTRATAVTGCSVTHAITTVRATSTAVVDDLEPICEPGTCDGGCVANEGEKKPRPTRKVVPTNVPTKAPAMKALDTRGIPSKGDWRDPEDYPEDERHNFVGHELAAIAEWGEYEPDDEFDDGYEPKLVNIGYSKHVGKANTGMITSKTTLFKDEVGALALEGLYGCTAVIVVSQRGAWGAHIFENRMKLENFERDVAEKLRFGSTEAPGTRVKENFFYGLEDLIGRPNLGDVGVLAGDVQKPPGGEVPIRTDPNLKLASEIGARAFIIAPRPRVKRAVGPGDRLLPESEFIDDMDLNQGLIAQPIGIALLGNMIERAMHINVQVVTYAPKPISNAIYQWSRRMRREREREGREETLEERKRFQKMVYNYQERTLQGTPRGKFLLQYHPAKTCNDKASWRLWIENQPVGDRTDSWVPGPDQIFTQGRRDSQNPEKRQACERPQNVTSGVSSRTVSSAASKGTASLPWGVTSGIGLNSSVATMPGTGLLSGSLTATSGTNSNSSRTNTMTLSSGTFHSISGSSQSATSSGKSVGTASASHTASSVSSSIKNTWPPTTITIVIPPDPTTSSSKTSSSSKPQTTSAPPPPPPPPTTSKPPPPPPPTSKPAPPPPPPKPTTGVIIAWAVVYNPRSFTGESGSWRMLSREGEDVAFDFCKADTIASYTPSKGVDSRPWPGSFEKVTAHGHKNCAYEGNEGGPGKFSCDKFKVDCIQDPGYDPKENIINEMCGAKQSSTRWFARVICWFPN